ncbi:hypothetical protein ERO13_A08G191932v2 [Gossypium hirsutum]|uniref:Uncharacterized protein n=2 Tax=Gossypium TaxID=3633 RepID=A0A5J5UUS8_GOSBA|nr:hypothetical protein ES319_A08G202600v1 [Gossypium barbadense]KAG4188856.1 hypothetical protein ERO13_A08G191932v2 [Gossypium hirsutum]TYH07322.1 hypothetical protein ES288_A08G224600v1 [Gossypium darwinii]
MMLYQLSLLQACKHRYFYLHFSILKIFFERKIIFNVSREAQKFDFLISFFFFLLVSFQRSNNFLSARVLHYRIPYSSIHCL